MGRLLEQIAKFSAVGLAAFLIDYGVLMLLSQALGVDAIISAGISFVVSVVFNYVASMRFVFAHREDLSRGRELAIFVVLSVVGLIINEGIMWVGVRLLGSSPLAVTTTKVVATAVVMVWNFMSRRRWLDAGSGGEHGGDGRALPVAAALANDVDHEPEANEEGDDEAHEAQDGHTKEKGLGV